jgi:hypothetical protein
VERCPGPGHEGHDRRPAELVLNRTWRPALAVTGADGLPAIGSAGNVLRPFTTLQAIAAPAADHRRRRSAALAEDPARA